MTIDTLKCTPLAHTLALQTQIRLPGTVGRLLKQVRDLERIAPVFADAGMVRAIHLPKPLTIIAAGIATKATTARALGGYLYASSAVRMDMSVQNGAVATIGQDSTCDIDDIGYGDQFKRLELVNVRQAYEMADAAMKSAANHDLIVMDCPLMLNRSMVPPQSSPSHSDFRKIYEDTIACIARFWTEHRERLFPWNPEGTVVTAVAAERHVSTGHKLKLRYRIA